jgi:hypothetical protein
VPALSVAGALKFAVKVVMFPLLSPVIVALARSTPVGTPADVVRIDTVKLGLDVQALPVDPQNSVKSAFTTGPLMPDVNVCAAQFTLSILPVPVVVPAVLD